MNKRAIALLTSFLMVASAATPAFADTYDTTEQTSVVQDSGTEAPAEETPTEEAAEEAPAEEAPDEGDTTEPSEEAPEDAPSEDVSEGDEGQSDEDVQPEVNEDSTPVEDTSDEEKPAEEAPSEETPAEETAPDEEKPTEDAEDEISDRPTEDTVTEETTEDAATEDDLLLTDEAVFGKDSDWMSVSGNVLTIKGEIKDIGSSGLAAYLSTYGIVDNITTIKTVSGAKAPVNSYGLFKQFPNLTTADLTNLDLSQATSMTSFFFNCPKLKTVTFSQSTVNANKVKTMTTMFRDCPSLTTLNNFQSVQVNSIVDMEYMFAGCTSLTYIRTPFTTSSNAVNISYMFSGCSALTGIYMCVNLSNSSTTWTNAFSGCDKLTYINNWIGSPTIPTSAALPNSTDSRWYSYADDKYTVVSGTGDTASFKMTTPTNNSLWYRRSWYTFNSSSGLFTIQGAVPVDGDHSVAVLAGVSVASVKRINYTNGASVTGNARDMFENLTNLTQVDLDNFDVSGATTMAWWFSGCSSLQTVNCENWNCTKVTSMYAMFYNCKKLTSVPDIASWSTPTGLTSVGSFYYGCTSLTHGYLPYCASATVTNAAQAYKGCSSMSNAYIYTNLSNTNINVDDMFSGTTLLEHIYLKSGTLKTTGSALPNTGLKRWYNSSGTLLADGFVMSGNSHYYRKEWATWDSSTGTLTITGAMPKTNFGTDYSENIAGQAGISRTAIKYIKTSSGAKAPASLYGMCIDLTNLISADLSDLDMTALTDSRHMFCSCANLTSVTFPSGTKKSGKITQCRFMFSECSKLTSIDISAFDYSTLDYSGTFTCDSMFNECSSLTQLTLPAGFNVIKGMKLPNGMTADYAYNGWGKSSTGSVISGMDSFAVFTNGSAKTTYYRVKNWFKWDHTNGILTIQGEVPEPPTSGDKNIVQRTGVSAITNSNVKQIKTVSGAKFLQKGGSHLCKDMTALTSVDLSNLDGSANTSFWNAFRGCSNLTSVNFGSMRTDNLADVQYMFAGCTKLTSIDLTKQSVTKIQFGSSTYYANMFQNCTALTSLGLPANFIMLEGMSLPNKDSTHNGWARSGTTTVVSGTGTYAVFNVGSTATTYVRLSFIAPTGITLNKSSATLKVDGTLSLTATVAPSNATDKSVTWTSSKTSVATVSSSGKVTAKAVGTATITCASVADPSIKATCKITVVANDVPPTGITLDKSKLTVAVNGTATLKATLAPENVTDHNVVWKSADTSIATVTNGVVKGIKIGKTTITVSAASDSSIKATCTVTVGSNKPAKPTVVIKPVFGGRTVQFNTTTDGAVIYYQTASSAISLESNKIENGGTIFLDKPMTGANAAIYYKAYKDGQWSDLGKWGVLNVQIAEPLIVQSGKPSENKFKVYTQTKDSYMVYTLDGTTPSIQEGIGSLKVTNGRIVWGTSTVVEIPKGKTFKVIAIRAGLVTSDVLTHKNES